MMRYVLQLWAGRLLTPTFAATIDLPLHVVTASGTLAAGTAGLLTSICPDLALGASIAPPERCGFRHDTKPSLPAPCKGEGGFFTL